MHTPGSCADRRGGFHTIIVRKFRRMDGRENRNIARNVVYFGPEKSQEGSVREGGVGASERGGWRGSLNNSSVVNMLN